MLPIPSEFVAAVADRFLLDSYFPRRARARNALACRLGLCGLRREEVSRIRMRDMAAGTLYVRTAKKGNPRHVQVGAQLVADILRWRLQWFGDTPPLVCVFTLPYGQPLTGQCIGGYVNGVTREICGRGFSFHCLRHTAATELYRETRDVLKVQRLLGHRSLDTTMKYLRTMVAESVDGRGVVPARCVISNVIAPPLVGLPPLAAVVVNPFAVAGEAPQAVPPLPGQRGLFG